MNPHRVNPLLTARVSSPRGFTLIELLTVVIIIAILLALSIAGLTRLTKNADAKTTRVILNEMANIATDYQTRTGTPAMQSVNAYKQSNSSDSIIYFIQQLKTNAPASFKLMKNINPDFIKDDPNNNNNEGVVDSWGNWIRYTTNGSPANGLPVRSTQNGGLRPYFASAGPDGVWGTFNSSTNQPDAAAKDNIYSFELTGHQNEGS